MFLKRLALASLAVGAGLMASGCTDGYGYSGVNVGYGVADYGYGDGYYGAAYGDPYYGGYGSSYFGWYGDFYYPGTGIYVYDRYRRPYRWNNDQRRYWEGRRGGYRGNPGGFHDNWGRFDRNRDGVPDGRGYRGNPGFRGNPGYRGNIDRNNDRVPDGRGAYRGNPGDGGQQGYRGGTPGQQRGYGYRRWGNQGTGTGATAVPNNVRPAPQNGGASNFGYRGSPATGAAAPRFQGGEGWSHGGHRGRR